MANKKISIDALSETVMKELNEYADVACDDMKEAVKSASTLVKNALANSAGISPSTIYSILNTKSMNPGIVTIKQICDGIDISLREFFDSPIFENLEQEIR